MRVERRKSPGGEYAIATGTCRIVRAKRRPFTSLVDFELAVDKREDMPDARMKATADTRLEPFHTLIDPSRVSSFVMANRVTTFRFRVESNRTAGVDVSKPYAELSPADVFSVLVDLAPAADLVALPGMSESEDVGGC